MKRIAIFALGIVCLGALNCLATDRPGSLKDTLKSVPAAELPAKAADLVRNAKLSQRGEVTVNVVRAAVGMNPAAAPAIVGAIARAVPDMAALAAGTAAGEQPKQASAIARAAAAAAPARAGKVVAAVCRVVPSEYRNIALGVSQVLPNSGQEILEGLETALPELKGQIQKVLAGYTGSTPSVAATLAQIQPVSPAPASGAEQAPLASIRPAMLRGPAIAPPYIPLSGTPTNVTPGTSGEVPPGGRNYAAP